jgi:hypothetical protein
MESFALKALPEGILSVMAIFSPTPEWAEIAMFQQPSHSDMIPA